MNAEIVSVQGTGITGGVRRILLYTALVVGVACWLGPGAEQAIGCSSATERIRSEQAYARPSLAPSLSDCRAYEQVSPVDKNGLDAAGGASHVRSAPDGERLVYFAVAPFPQTVGSAQVPTYLSSRLPGATWSTEGVEALGPPGAGEYVDGVSGDLGETAVVIQSGQSLPPCEPRITVCGGVQEKDFYVRNDVTGGFEFVAELGNHDVGLAGTDVTDSRVFFETEAKLTPDANSGVNLYEWDREKQATEKVSLVDVLPNGAAPGQGAYAGPGGPATGRVSPRQPRWYYYTQGAISPDGSRVFFTSNATGRIYMREPAIGRTVQISGRSGGHLQEVEEAVTGKGNVTNGSAIVEDVSVSAGTFMVGAVISGDGVPAGTAITAIEEGGKKIQISKGATETKIDDELNSLNPVQEEPAVWCATTTDGDYVFYTEGQELYRFNVSRFEQSSQPEDKALEEARERLTTGAEGVLGMLGISENDGAYAYFVAPGVLAGNENGDKEKAVKGAPNLYEWHEGALTFVAQGLGEQDWRGWTEDESEAQGPSGGAKSSRVTPDGTHLLFSSTNKMGSYNNNGFTEFYLYDAGAPLSATNPTCVTCDPSGVPASGGAHLENSPLELASFTQKLGAFLTRNLSKSGRRVFFETTEALVPGDANKQNDVYEWEADGEGSCAGEAQDHGCLYLISTGQSTQTYFGDASVNGGDVFFFTRQQLVSQDEDSNVDIYDARIEGGIPDQNRSGSVSPCARAATEASCRKAPAGVPSGFGVPTSTTVSLRGNLAPSPPTPPPFETRAEKLAKALKACRAKSRARRRGCERNARARFGPARPKTHNGRRRR